MKLSPSDPEDIIDEGNTVTEHDIASDELMDLGNAFLDEKMFKGEEEEVKKHEVYESEDTALSGHRSKPPKSLSKLHDKNLSAELKEKEARQKWLNVYNSSDNYPFELVNEIDVQCKSCGCNFDASNKYNIRRHYESNMHKDTLKTQKVKQKNQEEGELSKLSDTCLTNNKCEAIVSENVPKSKERDQSEMSHTSNTLGKNIKPSNVGDPLTKACEICGKVRKMRNFGQHMKKCHNVNDNFYVQCHWCNKKYSTKTYLAHAMRKHLYGNFICVCDECPFSAYSAHDLITHIKETHEDEELGSCPLCKKEVHLTLLDSHYQSCILNHSELSEMQNIFCDKCGKTFKTRKHYREHKKFHLREEGNEEGYYHCDKCDKKYTTKQFLKEHIQVVHENMKFNCEQCQTSFNSKNMLRNHHIRYHSTDKRFECKACGFRTGYLKTLRRHEEIHDESRERVQLQCSFCPKKLSSQQTLAAHERHHTGEKSFKCTRCPAAFTSNMGLAQHTKGVHKIAGQRGGKTGWSCGNKKT